MQPATHRLTVKWALKKDDAATAGQATGPSKPPDDSPAANDPLKALAAWLLEDRARAPVEWRWQAGAPIARAIPQEEYEGLRRDHEERLRVEAAEAAEKTRAAERAPRPAFRGRS